MYDLKTLISKLFSQLRIPSEGEIRKLQSRQVKNAHRQTDSLEESAAGERLNCDPRLRQRNMPLRHDSEMKSFNEFEEAN